MSTIPSTQYAVQLVGPGELHSIESDALRSLFRAMAKINDVAGPNEEQYINHTKLIEKLRGR